MEVNDAQAGGEIYFLSPSQMWRYLRRRLEFISTHFKSEILFNTHSIAR